MKRLIAAFILLMALAQVQAQRGTSSPYSIYGLGELVPFTNSATGAMGGLQQAVLNLNSINFSNPATLGGLRMHRPTINVDMEANYQYAPALDSLRKHGYFRNFGMGMRLNKHWATGFGVTPYSFNGYYEEQTLDLGDDNELSLINTGSGGLSRVYWANGLNIIQPKPYPVKRVREIKDSTGAVIKVDTVEVEVVKHLSLGITGSYLFGATQHLGRAQFPLSSTAVSTKSTTTDYWRGWQAEAGIFGMLGYENGFMIQGGITVSPTGALSHDNWTSVTAYSPTINAIDFERDTLEQDTTWGIKESLPWGGGAGITLSYVDRESGRSISLGAEVDYEAWTVANIDGYLSDRLVFRTGLEFNTTFTKNQVKPWSLRVGGVFDNGYVSLDQGKVKQSGMTFGIGIPFRERGTYNQSGSSVNLGAEVGVRGDSSIGLVRENYSRVFVGLLLRPSRANEWFHKRKYE